MDSSLHWLDPVAPIVTSPEFQPTLLLSSAQRQTLHTPLQNRLLNLKNEIERITPENYWDDAKKLTNPYEYIFMSLQRRMASSVASLTPLSRSYFKMIELWDLLKLDPAEIKTSAHTAEGPGGFLEAIQDRTLVWIPMVAMTLKSTERTVPGWRKSQAFLQKHPDVIVTYGSDGTGNLYSLANQDAFTASVRIALGKADLYTADGGFDFSADFNGQEHTVQRLLIAEALAGLTSLRVGGTMILKLFDTKSQTTLEFLWILSSCFHKTAFVKPRTSRPANSERYWIGSGLREDVPEWILGTFRHLTASDAPNGWDHLFVADSHEFPAVWLTQIQAFQEQVELHQYLTIQKTLELIRKPTPARIMELLTQNIHNSRDWCRSHKIPENAIYAGLTDEQVAFQNLEEALVPFQVSGAQTNLPGSFRLPQTHRVWTLPPSQRTLTGLAWRTELPASVLGRSPLQTAEDTPVETSLIANPPLSSPMSVFGLVADGVRLLPLQP